MAASSHRLATAVATRLRQVLPSGYSLESDGTTVLMYRDITLIGSSPAADIVDENDGRTLQDKAKVAIYAILGAVQDVVSEDLRSPWPLNSAQQMALPYVEIADRHVLLGYGEESRPTVVIQNIPLDELATAD